MMRTRIHRIHLPKRSSVAKFTGISIGLFIFANAGIWMFFRDRTYPRTQVADARIGIVHFDNLASVVGKLEVLPESLRFTSGSTDQTMARAELGITEDSGRTLESAKRRRSWLPIVNLFTTIRVSAPVHVDETIFRSASERLAATFRADPVNASLALDGTTVVIRSATAGYQLDTAALKNLVYDAIDSGNDSVAVPKLPVTAAVRAGDLSDERRALEDLLTATIILRYADKTHQPTPDDIARWFAPTGATYAISPQEVLGYVTKTGTDFGIRVQNPSQIVTAITDALSTSRTADITLTAIVAKKTYTYCVALRGAGTEHLAVFRSKLQNTLDDSRGWSLDGLVPFVYGESGCDFTVWLASADQMTSFNPGVEICDSFWSCRVGNNVIINLDRWQGASPAWNASGGSLDDYRSMVINHEVGHRLDFRHAYCAGPGQPAPVMQQQSIDLQGCSFNPWPLPSELAAFRAKLGI